MITDDALDPDLNRTPEAETNPEASADAAIAQEAVDDTVTAEKEAKLKIKQETGIGSRNPARTKKDKSAKI